MSYYEQLKGHCLEPLEIGQAVKSFYLREKPGSLMMSSLIIFSPAGIVITGDLHPGRLEARRSGVIAPGYGLEWFSAEHNERYLAQKFLTEVWVPERFKQFVREMICDRIRERTIDRERKSWRVGGHALIKSTEERALKYLVEHEEMIADDTAAYENIPAFRMEAGAWRCPFDASELVSPGYDYDPVEVGWLAAIQRRFRELIGPLGS